MHVGPSGEISAQVNDWHWKDAFGCTTKRTQLVEISFFSVNSWFMAVPSGGWQCVTSGEKYLGVITFALREG